MSDPAKKPAVSEGVNVSEHAELMRQMGSKNGYDPMPPSQHRFLLDVREPAVNRAIAWVWSKTIRPGKGRKRSPFARDERGDLTLTHAAADLGWDLSNASKVFKQLEEQKRIRRDENRRIWLEGDVPEPTVQDFCTELMDDPDPNFVQVKSYHLPGEYRLYLQQLDEFHSQQGARAYFELQEYRQRLETDAMAVARAKGYELEAQLFEAVGFKKKKERRGRRKAVTTRTPILQVELSQADLPPTFVQITGMHSVQKGNGFLYEAENDSVQRALNKESELSESSEVSESQPPAPAQADSLTPTPTPEPNPVVEVFEEFFGPLAPDDPVVAKILRLPEELKLPPLVVCSYARDKVEEKRGKRYRIDGPVALLGWLRSDIQRWTAQHADEIRLHRAMWNAPSQQVDDAELERWRAEQEAALNDPNVSDHEKHLIRLCLGLNPEPRTKAQKAGGV